MWWKKKKRTPEEVIAEVARREKISVEEVRFNITQAIRIGMMDPDPKAREMWSRFPVEGRMPTPEEFLYYLPKIFNLSGDDE